MPASALLSVIHPSFLRGKLVNRSGKRASVLKEVLAERSLVPTRNPIDLAIFSLGALTTLEEVIMREENVLSTIRKRRSIRKYTAQAVTDEQIRQLLEAAMAAPSADNIQPWEFVVVKDSDLKRELARTHHWSGMAADAAVVFVVCGDERASRHWVEDASAATENLLLAATALGLGAVWVAIYPTTSREAHVRRVLAIPKAMRVLCLVPVGHPAESKPPRTKYKESKVHYEGW